MAGIEVTPNAPSPETSPDGGQIVYAVGIQRERGFILFENLWHADVVHWMDGDHQLCQPDDAEYATFYMNNQLAELDLDELDELSVN